MSGDGEEKAKSGSTASGLQSEVDEEQEVAEASDAVVKSAQSTAPVPFAAEVAQADKEDAPEDESESDTASAESAGDSSGEPKAESQGEAKKSGRRRDHRAKAKESSSKEDTDEGEVDEPADEETSSNEEHVGVDDPLGEAYCLDDGSPIQDGTEEVLPWRSDVASPKEFFSTEILYRYDILDSGEQKALKGSYRLDLKGDNGGVWGVSIDGELQVQDSAETAEIEISMQQKDFMNIINGRLNPQLAILADKISIKGDTRRAVIFQSLLTPTPE